MRKILPLLLVLVAVGCSPRHYQPVMQRDSTYKARVDSVYLRDSVFIDRFRTIREKGDTVYVTDTRTEYRDRWRDRIVRDTAYLDREVTVTVEVPAQLTRWQILWIRLGKVFAAVLAVLAVIMICRLFGKGITV